MKVKLKLMNVNKASKSWLPNSGSLSDTAGRCKKNAQKQGAAKKGLEVTLQASAARICRNQGAQNFGAVILLKLTFSYHFIQNNI